MKLRKQQTLCFFCAACRTGEMISKSGRPLYKSGHGQQGWHQVMPLCLLGSHFSGDHHCWDPVLTFCKPLMAQKWSAHDRGVSGHKTAHQRLHHSCPFQFIPEGVCMYFIHMYSHICFRHGASVRLLNTKRWSEEAGRAVGRGRPRADLSRLWLQQVL